MTSAAQPHHQEEGRLLEIGGLSFVVLAIILLALGGLATGTDPTAFDLWVLAIGLFLIAGGIVWYGVQRELAIAPVPAPHPFAGPASLAQAPLLSATLPADPYGLGRPASVAGGWGASDSIAGQYAEAARLRSGRYTQRRLGTLAEPPPPSPPPTVPFWANLRREAAPAREAGPTPGAMYPVGVEAELERLRSRIADLEAGRAPLAGTIGGTCAGCHAGITGAPGEGLCPHCDRPLCASCYAATPSGPEAHWCPDCRVGRRVSPPIAGPPVSPGRSVGASPAPVSG